MNGTKYSRRDFLRTSAMAMGSVPFLFSQTLAAAASKKVTAPNIIFFLTDDLGWMDSSVYGSEYYKTPNMERLSKKGIVFTNAYAANPLCSPTRASIYTGKYPCRLGITTPACGLPDRPDLPILPSQDQTPQWWKVVVPRSRRFLPLEEYTVAEAFRDAGYRTGFIGKWHLGADSRYWPLEQGFQTNIAGEGLANPPSYFPPYYIKTLSDGPQGEYLTDRLTTEAENFIEKDIKNPFMLFLCHYAVHSPFQAKKDLIEKYKNKKDPRGKQLFPTMAAMIESMDQSLGRVLDKIERLGIADNTIVIFFSDNGGDMYDLIDGVPATNNWPLRNGKGSIYEGGVRVPCIISWPKVINGNSKTDAVISSIDFYPTMLEMANITAQKGTLFDGISIVPVLKGTNISKERPIFCHFPDYVPSTQTAPATTVRMGDWKLIRLYGEGAGQTSAYELYDLAGDIGEARNLAGEMPAKVSELDALIDKHLKDTGAVIPLPNPAYSPLTPVPTKGYVHPLDWQDIFGKPYPEH